MKILLIALLASLSFGYSPTAEAAQSPTKQE